MFTTLKMTKNDCKTIIEEMERVGLNEVEISVTHDREDEINSIDFDFWVNGEFISTALTIEKIT